MARQVKRVRATKYGQKQVIKDTAKMTGRQRYRYNLEKEKTKRMATRTSEAEKTARAKARAAALATSATAISGQGASIAKTEAQQRTQQVKIAQQYANLINGNQNQPNAAKPEDSSSNENQSAYTAVEIL